MFTATASQHDGQETTIVSFHVVLMHLGFVVIGLPYTFKGQLSITQVHGASPYGASTIVGSDGTRLPSTVELEAARHQGYHVAKIASGRWRAARRAAARVGILCCWRPTMPRPAAREAALRAAWRKEKIMPDRNWGGWQVAIGDGHGHPVDSVPVELVPPESQLPG